jgi:hypothetical protein
MKKTINDIVFTEPYKGENKLETKMVGGIAMVSQKTNLIGLKVLTKALLRDGTEIPIGSKVYLKEETLFNDKFKSKSNKPVYDIKDEELNGFYIIEAKDIVAIDVPESDCCGKCKE